MEKAYIIIGIMVLNNIGFLLCGIFYREFMLWLFEKRHNKKSSVSKRVGNSPKE